MDVQNCIKTIQGKPTGLLKFRVSYTEKIKCISELAQYSDKYLDSIIMSATRDEEPFVQEMAAAVIVARFNELRGAREIEERMCGMLLQTTDPALWYRTRTLDEAIVLVSIASICTNGYVRQAALEQMSSTPDWRYIPFILRRTGDWVPQVRAQAARMIADERVKAGYWAFHRQWLGLDRRVGRGRRDRRLRCRLFDHDPISRDARRGRQRRRGLIDCDRRGSLGQ